MLLDFDVLIVGAGPAGCAAAFDLARAGRRVLLLDKRSFPRSKACACGLTRKTLKALRYTVAPVLERECRDVVLQEAGPAFLTGSRAADKACEVRVRLRNPFCAMAVRERFDQFCLEQTLAEGASGRKPELRKIQGIVALRELPTHIELDLTLPGGLHQTLRAPVLIGADGSNGQTRRLATGIAFHNEAKAPSTTDLSSPTPGLSSPTPGLSSPTSGLSSRSAATGSAFLPSATNPGAPSFAALPQRVGSQQQSPGVPISGLPTPREATAAHLPPEPPWYARGFALEAAIPYAVLPPQLPAADAPLDLVFDFSPIAGGYGWLFPKGDHINIGVGGFVPQETDVTTGKRTTNYEAVTRALLADYTQAKLGVDLTTLSNAHITGQHLGLGGHAYHPQGRILLTGDAAGLVDPLTGEGIHSALVSGQAAAAAILETLPAQQPDTSAGASSFPALSQKRGSRQLAAGVQKVGSDEANRLAAAYTRHLHPLLETLIFSHRAARSFYREPGRGFRIMRTPLLRNLVLKTYADGLPTTKLLTKLARRVA